MPNAHGRANVCAHRKSIKPCNFQICFGAYYKGWYVVVHLYSNSYTRRQMAPVQSIKFQTANFPIFCTRIIVIFWTTCIARGVFPLVIMGNLTHILQVLQWLEVVITGRICPKGSSAGISFTHGPISGFFAPQKRHVALIKVKCQIWTWSVEGWGFTAPKTVKKLKFTNIIAPKGRVPCTIFYKFYRVYARPQST